MVKQDVAEARKRGVCGGGYEGAKTQGGGCTGKIEMEDGYMGDPLTRASKE
jgi:hypothetical protein